MTFFALGINHETAPLSVREAFALGADRERALLDSLALSPEAEVVVLSTCNRTEAYLYGSEQDVRAVRDGLSAAAGREWPEAGSFCFEDERAVAHVIRVTAGLESMILGDIQILAQMKDAYRIAVAADRVGTVLHRLMHTAFRTAKRVLTGTGIGSGAASISSAAVALARAHFGGSLADRTVLVVGTGEVGRLVLHALASTRPARIIAVNRTQEQDDTLVARVGAEVGSWEDRHRIVASSDLVIVATGADEPVLRSPSLANRMNGDQPTLVIDLGVPRNVDPVIDELSGYQVVDMDALDASTREVEAARREELPKAKEIVAEELAEFVAWMFHQQALQPAIQAIRDTFDRIRQEEIDRHQHRFAETDRAQLDLLTRSIMQKLLSVPIVRLKASDPDSVDLVRGVRLLQSFFARPECEEESARTEPNADASLHESRAFLEELPITSARPTPSIGQA